LCLPKEVQNMTIKTFKGEPPSDPCEFMKPKNRGASKLPFNFLYNEVFEYVVKKNEKT